MNKSKFSLAEVILVLTAVAFGFVCFLGANFYTLGDTKKSLIFAGVITILLAGLAYLAKFLKGVQGNFKTNFFVEIVVLVLFTVAVAFFTYSPFSHYFTVSDKKGVIKRKLEKNIEKAQNMFSEYEKYAAKRISRYEQNLESVVRNRNTSPQRLNDFGINTNTVSYQIQINNKKRKLKNDLFPTNYTDTISGNGIKQIAKDWLADAQKKTTGWKPIGIVGVVNDIEQKSISWRDKLVNNSSEARGDGEIRPEKFNYPLPFNDLKTNFTTKEKPTLLSIGLAFVAWLLMLLPWFVTKRSTKVFRGRLAPYEVEL